MNQTFRRVAYHKEKDKHTAIFNHLHYCIQCKNSNIDNNFKALKRCGDRNLKTETKDANVCK